MAEKVSLGVLRVLALRGIAWRKRELDAPCEVLLLSKVFSVCFRFTCSSKELLIDLG